VSLARRTADAIGQAVAEVLENEAVAARRGLVQQLDPRVKLITLVGFAVVASLLRSPWMLAAWVVLTWALAVLSRVSLASFLRKVWSTAGLYAVLVALPAATAWVTPGPVWAAVGPLTFSLPGARMALTLVLRVVASAGFALLVVWTTRWSDLLAALSAWRVPDVIVGTLAMAQKQIVSLLRTVEQMHLARESRTLDPAAAEQERAWVVDRMAFVVQKSMKTADDVYDAMVARGYTGAMHSLVQLRLTRSDGWWLTAGALLAVIVWLIDRGVMAP
jgi:cobalt/nickel transport system permease protein